MLKKIIIEDFEAHQYTELKFGPGLNVIHGQSNNGKSASLRALELPAYGVWAAGENKKEGVDGPVRVGQKSCKVTAESDKGSVEVNRGKSINEWIIKNTEIDEEFKLKNPGAGPIPQAQEVLGLKSIEIAGAQIRFNWSDQRDKHFLIDEVEGKNSSPSFVAGVLDEVGGLSGCEDLVRALASDKGDFEKEMKKAAENSQKIDEDLIKYKDLDDNINLCNQSEEKLNQSIKIKERASRALSIYNQINDIKNKLDRYKDLEDKIEKTKKALDKIEKCQTQMSDIIKAHNIFDLFIEKSDKYNKLQKELDHLDKFASVDIESCQIKINNAIKAYNLFDVFKVKSEKDKRIQKQLDELNKIALIDIEDKRIKAKEMQHQSEKMRTLLAQIEKIQNKIKGMKLSINFRKAAKTTSLAENNILELEKAIILIQTINNKQDKIKNIAFDEKEVSQKYVDLQKEYKDITKEIKICPTCGQVITDECIQEITEGVY